MAWCAYNPELVSRGNCVVLICDGQGSVGFANYMESDFLGTVNLMLCYNEDHMNKYTGLFLATILSQERPKYSFGRKWKIHLKETEIKLPQTPAGAPDWNFMEQYIKSLNYKLPTTANHKNNKSLALDVERWKPFAIKDIFELQIGKAHSEMLDEGNDVPYIGAKKDDNGVMCHCAYNTELVQKGNCIIFICNGQGSVGYANYMNQSFIGTTDIVAGYNNHLNQYNGLFIATVLCLERSKYSFGRKWKTHLNDTKINLPANKEGFPDWVFMESYMKSLPYGDRI